MQLQRTQIYLNASQIQQLKLEAQKAQVPMSELIRKAIDHYLAKSSTQGDWSKDPLMKAIGQVTLSVTDASTRTDDYLYG